MNRHTPSGTTWNNSSIITAYKEEISYDANGNILRYKRNGANQTGMPLDMDSLGYHYNTGNNQLNFVSDNVPASNYTEDIDNQSANNYGYDKIGNLKKDVTEGIDTIRWTVYGKINKIVKGAANTSISYNYDANGNRTVKEIAAHDTLTKTFYVRDAQGNVMAVYKKDAGDLKWSEQHLYGSSRLGLWQWNNTIPLSAPNADNGSIYDNLNYGSRNYELTNHLGNVLATISDKKIGHPINDTTVDYFKADVVSANDYYPGGMTMPGRQFTQGSNSYRYGFGDHEKLDEIYGSGNTVDMGGRLLDTRLGRTPSADPERQLYPGISPYAYAIDNPVNVIDPDGKLIIFINGQQSGFGGGKDYWEGVDRKIENRIGDHHTMYRDGSSGGFLNTLSRGLYRNNLNPFARKTDGANQGRLDAKRIIAGLKRDPNDPNKIIESIKVVTHSMGTAYSRGYTEALEEYVSKYNNTHKDAPLTGFRIETQVDIAAFQGFMLPIKSKIQNKLFMSGDADGIANGVVAEGKAYINLKALSPLSDVPGKGSTEIPTDAGTGHGIAGFGKKKYLDLIPTSSNNGDAPAPMSQYVRPDNVPDASKVVTPTRKLN